MRPAHLNQVVFYRHFDRYSSDTIVMENMDRLVHCSSLGDLHHFLYSAIHLQVVRPVVVLVLLSRNLAAELLCESRKIDTKQKKGYTINQLILFFYLSFFFSSFLFRCFMKSIINDLRHLTICVITQQGRLSIKLYGEAIVQETKNQSINAKSSFQNFLIVFTDVNYEFSPVMNVIRKLIKFPFYV